MDYYVRQRPQGRCRGSFRIVDSCKRVSLPLVTVLLLLILALLTEHDVAAYATQEGGSSDSLRTTRRRQQQALPNSSTSSSSSANLVLARKKTVPKGTRPKPTPAAPKAYNNQKGCSSLDDFRFESAVILTFQGRPGRISASDVQVLQRAVTQAYEQVATCNDTPGGFIKLFKVNILRNQVNSFGSTIAQTAIANITQQFSLIASVEIACRGCRTQPYRLFRLSQGTRLLTTTTTTTSKTSLAGNRGGSGGTGKYPEKKSLLKACICSVPTVASFIKSFNMIKKTSKGSKGTRLLVTASRPSSIDMLVGVTELERNTACTPAETPFQTFLTVTFTGGVQNISVDNMQQRNQLLLLQEAVLQSYNSINALNTAGVCDTFFLVVTDIAIVRTSGSSGYGATALNRRERQRHLQSTYTNNVVFNITGSCHGCPGNQQVLFNSTAGKRRLLQQELTMALDDLHQPMELGNSVQEDRASLSALMFPERRLPVISGMCYCPLPTNEFRLPTQSEFVNALDTRIAQLESAGLINLVDSVAISSQNVPVNCSANVTVYETTIDVVLSTFFDTNITSSQANQLTQAFLSTYNGLAQQYCDPLFRTVASAQLEDAIPTRRRVVVVRHDDEKTFGPSDGSDRVLATTPSSVRFRYKLVVRCRGCTKSTPLFNDATKKNRALNDIFNSLSIGVSSSGWASESRFEIERRTNGVHHHRSLQATNQSSQCFCPVNSLDSRAPNTTEFLVAYNRTLAAANISTNVATVTETVTTPAPTKSPMPPSPRPMPPTKRPSKRPTKRPSIGPTKRPSNRPTKRPSNRPTKRPTVPPTKRPFRSVQPSLQPSDTPSDQPSNNPSLSMFPSVRPSSKPSNSNLETAPPTQPPTKTPTLQTTPIPTRVPTQLPTLQPPPQTLAFIPTQSPLPSQTPTITPAPASTPSFLPVLL